MYLVLRTFLVALVVPAAFFFSAPVVGQGIYAWLIIDILTCLGKCGTAGSTLAIIDEGGLNTINDCSTVSGSIFIHSTSDIDDLTLPPTLQHLTGGCLCTGGNGAYEVDSISANGLQTVATDKSDNSTDGIGLVISDYQTLTSLSFPNLTTIGSNFVLHGNPSVSNVNGFNSLNAVSGNVDITGNFATLDFPSLAVVNGSFNVQSTASNFTCPDFSHVAIKGSFMCAGGVSNPQALTVDNSTTSSSSLANLTTVSVSPSASATGASSSTSGVASASTTAASEGVSVRIWNAGNTFMNFG